MVADMGREVAKGNLGSSGEDASIIRSRPTHGAVIDLPLGAEQSVVRLERLSRVIEEKVIPRLLGNHADVADADECLHPALGDIAELSRLIVGPVTSGAVDFIRGLRERGLSLDALHVELLEPTARYLGELWSEDKIDLLDVTIGVTRLQNLVHIFAGLDEVAALDDKRRVLIAPAPGEQHSFGIAMVQRFFHASSWQVCDAPVAGISAVADVVADDWIGVVGLSLSVDRHLDGLDELIANIRALSVNRNIAIMVGGPAFAGKPGLAAAMGADGTAANAPAAVVLAKKLLVQRHLALN